MSDNSGGKSKTTTIQGKDINDLRVKLKEQTQNISIDPNSINVDIDNYKVSYNSGDKKIQTLSLIFDDKGQLSNRLMIIKSKNPTMEIIEQGKDKNIDWVVVII